ncbi:prolactin-releasing peptide receptor-like [Macrobrachium rosenbergii]|uniref:prolactin-releasing peptide receptor-like n=1 Tax=Macrobrachium rosenbergii TaxID=79674 RepID=UPI0034D4EADF
MLMITYETSVSMDKSWDEEAFEGPLQRLTPFPNNPANTTANAALGGGTPPTHHHHNPTPGGADGNSSAFYDNGTSAYYESNNVLAYPITQAVFYIEYLTIFLLGIFGNCLVCYVVVRSKHMHTVTNYFITNLALADILLCVLAVPFTPLYTFIGQWVFGSVLCHLVTMAQGISVYVSSLTLMSIAIDRYFVIIYPFRPRLQITTCYLIIVSIWLFSITATLPYALYIGQVEYEYKFYCEEYWPSEFIRQVFSGCTAIMQFAVPFVIILYCYVKISVRMNKRVKAKPGCKSSKKEEADRERKRRTNRMLIAMVTIFGTSWLPMNVVHLVGDYNATAGSWSYYNLCFFITHVIAMSSTCYNPFLYAWLNDNFRKEFQLVLPCFHQTASSAADRVGQWRSERTCNGNETQHELLLQSGGGAGGGGGGGGEGVRGGGGSGRSLQRQASSNDTPPPEDDLATSVEAHQMATFVVEVADQTNGDSHSQTTEPLVNGQASDYV